MGRRRPWLEILEDRLAPALLPPLVQDDFATTDSNAVVQINVLANDFDPDGTVNLDSLRIASGPNHGTAIVQQNFLTIDDDGSPVGNGRASALADVVGAESQILLVVSDISDPIFTGPGDSDDYALFVRLGKSDFSNFDPAVFDYQFHDSFTFGPPDTFTISGLAPGTPYLAWIDNTVGPDTPDTVMATFGWTAIYTPDTNFHGTDSFTYTVTDDDGLVSNEATVTVTVRNQAPDAGADAVNTIEGTSITVDVLGNDFDPESALNPSSLTITMAPARGTARVEETAPGTFALVYTPDTTTTGPNLVVDDPGDLDDGDYSPGHLSLREAIRLANADSYQESFRYAVRDEDGAVSNEATVTVNVSAQPTTITFAPELTATGPATLWISQAGDGSEGNSAFAITTPLTIEGPAGANCLTLAGPGSGADLRAFLVTGGGQLTLANLTLTNWASDASGGALAVVAGASATLNHCTLAKNSAYFRGGAISNFGTVDLIDTNLADNSAGTSGGAFYNAGMLTLTDCTIDGNEARQGGGFSLEWAGRVGGVRVSITNNGATEQGGGFCAYRGSVALTDSTIAHNFARTGGGFDSFSGGVKLTNSTITDNAATFGGGFATSYDLDWVKANGPGYINGNARLTNCTLSGNTAEIGGAFYNLLYATLTNCTLTDNRANKGGGFYSTSPGLLSDTTLTGCTLVGNVASEGGGIYLDLGSLDLTRSSLVGNSATNRGGGIFNNSFATLVATTLAGNSASLGGGLYNELGQATLVGCTVAVNRGGGIYNHLNTTRLTSTLVAGNVKGTSACDIAGPTPVDLVHSSHNLIGKGGSGGLISGTRGNQVGVQPFLAPLGLYGGPVPTFALLPGSPALDAGLGTGTDVRGVAPVGRRDIGAFESKGFTLTRGVGSGQTAGVNQKFFRPLTVTVSARNPVEPVVGGWVTFVAPTFGSSAILSAIRARIGTAGNASVTARANSLAGDHAVSAFARGAAPAARFVLHNRGGRWNALLLGRVGAAAPQVAPAKVPSPSRQQNRGETPIASILATVVARNGDRYHLDGNYTLMRTIGRTGQRVIVDRIVQSVSQGPDGTLYKLGGLEQGPGWIGTTGPSYPLWRLGTGRTWQLAIPARVLSYAVAQDGTLHVLTEDRQLQRLLPGALSWTVLDTDVQAFTLTRDGTLYELNGQAELKRLVGISNWTTLEVGVESFSVAADGTLHALNARGELKRLVGLGNWTTLETDVKAFARTPEGIAYSLNALGELKQWEPGQDAFVLAEGVQSFTTVEDRVFYLDDNKSLVEIHRVREWIRPGTSVVKLVPFLLDEGVTGFGKSSDGCLYYLNGLRQLKRLVDPRKPATGANVTLLDVGVRYFTIAPNDDVYWLDDHDELNRFQDGYYIQTDHVEVPFFTMTREGTIYIIRPSYFGSSFRSPERTYVRGPIGAAPPISEDIPDPAFVLAAAGISDPDAQVTTELIVDQIDPPRFFPRVGLAQMHHCIWKCTIYFTTLEGPQVRIFTTDTNDLHLFAANPTPADVSPVSGNRGQARQPQLVPTIATTAGRIGEPLSTEYTGLSLTVGPDGTLYRLGPEGNGYHWLGPNRLPRILWRLAPGSTWQPASPIGVFSFGVAADNTLYLLDANHELRKLALGSDWTTLDVGVQAFALAPDGTVYALSSAQELRCLLPGSATWTVLEVGVQSFTMAPDGTLYQLNRLGELKRRIGRDDWSTLDVGVQSFWMASDGTVFELNGQGELKRLRGEDDWSILDIGVVSFATDFAGTIYALDTRHQLKRLTPRDHWVVFATGVQSFVVSPSAFANVYVLEVDGTLKRLEAGYSWQVLREDVRSLTLDSEGTIHASDDQQVCMYWSSTPAPFLPPIRIDAPPPICENPPDTDDILRAAHIPSGPNVQVVTELLQDEIDLPRYYDHFAMNRLHHCHWKCTISYTDDTGPRTQVIFIDRDHLHFDPGQGPEPL